MSSNGNILTSSERITLEPWGDYAFKAHDAHDPNPRHFYWVSLMEESFDKPEHRFGVSWIDTDTDQDEHFGENLSLDEAFAKAEQHCARRRVQRAGGAR